jgi:hypothetical protein
MRVVIGCEGGATRSSFVLCDAENAKQLATHTSGPSNAWVLGFPVAAATIVESVSILLAHARAALAGCVGPPPNAFPPPIQSIFRATGDVCSHLDSLCPLSTLCQSVS